MFTPRTPLAAAIPFLAKILARTKLTDTTIGSWLERYSYTHGEDVSTVEQRIASVRDTYDILNPAISDADLDERASELPQGKNIPRLPVSNASGTVLSVTRLNSVGVQVLPAKTLVSRPVDGVKYRTTQDYAFADGVGTITGVNVICMIPGTKGNCAAGAISKLEGSPAWVSNVINLSGLTSGNDGETKGEYQTRIAKYLQSLARSQMAALEFAAGSYTATSGERVKFAKGYQDFTTPGISFMMLDDGSGMVGLTKVGSVVSGTVPLLGARFLWHEGPATAPIPQVDVLLAGGGHKTLVEGQDYVSLYERGIILLASGAVAAGDVWTVSGYTVRTGIFSEVQRLLDGDPAQGMNSTGWTAAGCRCVVRPADVVYAFFDMHVVPQNGYDAQLLTQAARSLAIAYLASLGPGEPLYVSRLIAAIMQLSGILSVYLYQQGGDPSLPPVALTDQYVNALSVIRATTNTIGLVPVLP